MIRMKLLRSGAIAAVGWLAWTQRQGIVRYLKIKQMSAGDGHPGNVPAGGAHAYPAPGQGTPDGTGDFASANRGGPAQPAV